jgi:hypothetical protein
VHLTFIMLNFLDSLHRVPCRSVFDYRRSHQGDSNLLPAICGPLIVEDVRAKLGALKIEAQRIAMRDRLGTLLRLAETAQWDSAALQNAVLDLDWTQREIEAEARETASAPLELVASLYEELSAYLYLALAAMESFGLDSESLWQARDKAKIFDRLAEARQWLAVHRPTAVGIIQRVRQDLGTEPKAANAAGK